MPEDRICGRPQHREVQPGWRHVSVTADPPTLTVADEGEGLASPAAFSRGTSGGGSSGLGLDIVRQIAEGSGGSVTLGRGPGTSIKVRFGTPADPEETA